GIALAEAGQLDEAEHLVHAAGDLRPRPLPHGKPEGDVFRDRHVREEGVVLEYDADVAQMRQHVIDDLAAQHDLTGGRREEAGDALEQRGLAAAGGPEQREELPGRDVEMHAIDRGHRPIAAGDADQAQIGRRLHWSGHRAGLHRRRAVHSRTRGVRPTAQWASRTTANVTRTRTGTDSGTPIADTNISAAKP